MEEFIPAATATDALERRPLKAPGDHRVRLCTRIIRDGDGGTAT
jgi:hypothetical protein